MVVLAAGAVSLSNTMTPIAIVIHHSALTKEDLDYTGGASDVTAIDRLHQRRGYAVFYWGHTYHVAYHYVILPDGTVQGGRPERCRGAHTSGHAASIGICLIGNFSSESNSSEADGNQRPTANQLASLGALVSQLRSKYSIGCDHIFQHKQLSPKTLCPGDRFPWMDFRFSVNCGEIE
jgi:N-acetylmuramoyl-L-alanine amidase